MAGSHMSQDEFIEALLSPDRALDPYELLTRLPIDPYQTVADLGCGPGYYSLPLAKHLSHGKLYALDVDDLMLDALRRRLSDARLGNVEALKTGGLDFPIPPSSLDGLLVAYVVHHSPDAPAFMRAAARLLKPSGWACVLEWHRVETEDGPPLEERIGPAEMASLGRDAGLIPLRRHDLKDSQYMMLFKGPAAP